MNNYITVEQLAKILKISPSRVRSRICQGCSMPKSMRFGRRRLFKYDDVMIWMESKYDVSTNG